MHPYMWHAYLSVVPNSQSNPTCEPAYLSEVLSKWAGWLHRTTLSSSSRIIKAVMSGSSGQPRTIYVYPGSADFPSKYGKLSASPPRRPDGIKLIRPRFPSFVKDLE